MGRVVDVVDRDVGLALGIELQDAGVPQDAVRVELDAALAGSRPRLAIETKAECERPLGAVRTARATIAWFFDLAAHLEDAHRRLERARRRRRERGVGRDQDLGVPGAGRQRGGEPQRVPEVADVGGGRDRGDRLP